MLAPDFKPEPYWWDVTPCPELGEPSLPGRVDAVVIGSGYTGLSAALQLARGGRSTLVLDAEAAGWGCSTRNGGQVSAGVKPSFASLAAAHGEACARGIIEEGQRSLAWLGAFIASEGIVCDYRVCGRFHGAHSARQYQALAREVASPPAGIDIAARLVPRGEQAREIGTEAYHGGVVYTRSAALDPARYHAGLLDRVRGAGATVVAHCAATAIAPRGGGFRVETVRGSVEAQSVIVATNAYCDRATPASCSGVHSIDLSTHCAVMEWVAPRDRPKAGPRAGLTSPATTITETGR